MMPHRLLIVSPKLVAGGEERDLVDLLKNIDRIRFKPYICLFDSTGEFTKEVPGDVEVFDLGKRSRWDAAAMVLKLARKIDDIRPDIVLSSLLYSTALVSAATLLARHSFVFVAREPHNHKQDFSGWNLRDVARRAMMDYGHRRPDIVIAVSKGAADDIAENYGIEPGRMRFIHSSVDIEKIKLMASEKAVRHDGKKTVITLGRLVARKGFDYLIKSFKEVRRHFDNSELVIIGDGPEKVALEELASSLGLSGFVSFPGFIGNPYGLIASSDVFVCSSLWEGFGKVIIEAFVCGTPVVATRCPFGPEEIITDGVDGLLVPVKDPSRMAESIIRVLGDTTLFGRLKEASRGRAEDFSVRKNVAAHEMIFDELLRR